MNPTSVNATADHTGRRLRWVPQRPVRSPGVAPQGWAEIPQAAELLTELERAAGAGGHGTYLVRGGPACGASSLLAAAVAALVAGGVAANRIAVVGSSPRSVALLRQLVEAACAARPEDAGRSGMEPQVRTVHALAFAVVAAAAARAGVAPPRLLTGAEHDVIFREALAGYALDGAAAWPERVRPALATRGFARDLRDVMLRMTECSVSPERLAELGAAHGRPLWQSAADFMRRHEQEMELRFAGTPGSEGFPSQLDAAQLVGRAIEEIEAAPDLLEGARRCDVLVVDDAQLIDPMSGELLARLAERERFVVVAADRDTAVFRFRGASEAFVDWVREQATTEVVLARSWRAAPVLAPSALFARRLPGSMAWRHPAAGAAGGEGAPGEGARGEAAVVGQAEAEPPARNTTTMPAAAWHTAATPAEEAAAIADYLLRLHLLDEVPWENMAVVQRTVGAGVELLQRTFDAAGIPVVDAGAEVPPVDDPLVRALLDVAESVIVEPDEAAVRRLLTGPLGKADPADLRDLRRFVRHRHSEGTPERSMDSVRELLLGAEDPAEVLGQEASGRLVTPLQRIRALRAVVAASLAAENSVEMVLWDLWHATAKAHSLREVVSAGGVPGRAADRSADAVLDLFDHAADFVEQMPRGSLRQFVEMLRQEELPAPRRAGRRPTRRAVQLLSAHNCVATEFDVVVVAGIQDGTWPAPRRRFGLFELELLVDLLDNPHVEAMPDAGREVAAAAAAAADERRLMVLATSRARRHVLCTAVDDADGDLAASLFLDELRAAGIPQWSPPTDRSALVGHRVFSPAALVADIRGFLQADPPAADAAAAARLLATLAAADTPGADPAGWYRARPVSSQSSPFPAPDRRPRARLSPSGMETLQTCPLRWFIERQIGTGGEMPLVRGTVAHLAAQALEAGVPEDQIAAAVAEFWPALSGSRGWVLETEIEDFTEMVSIARSWIDKNRPVYEAVGIEQRFTMDFLPPAGGQIEDEPAVSVRVSGRIDRLEQNSAGEFRAVDFKTSGSLASGEDAAANPQLGLYQLAIRLGALRTAAERDLPPVEQRYPATEDEAAETVNTSTGGVLVYLAPKVQQAKGVPERHQPPMEPARHRELVGRALTAGARSLGPQYQASTNSGCDTCAARVMCPVQQTGKQVGR